MALSSELWIIGMWLAAVVVVYIEYVFVRSIAALAGQWLLLLCILGFLVSQSDFLGGLRWPLAVVIPLAAAVPMAAICRRLRSSGRSRLNLLNGDRR